MDVSGQSWSQSIFLRDGKNVINFFFNKGYKISILKLIKFLPVSDTELYESANFTLIFTKVLQTCLTFYLKLNCQAL